MEFFHAQPGETIIYSGNGMYFKSKLMAYPGEIYVTDRRVVFEKWNSPGSSPLSRMFVKSQRRGVVFEIPLNTITRVYWHKVKIGFGKKMHIVYGNEERVLIPDELEKVLNILPKVEGEQPAP